MTSLRFSSQYFFDAQSLKSLWSGILFKLKPVSSSKDPRSLMQLPCCSFNKIFQSNFDIFYLIWKWLFFFQDTLHSFSEKLFIEITILEMGNRNFWKVDHSIQTYSVKQIYVYIWNNNTSLELAFSLFFLVWKIKIRKN